MRTGRRQSEIPGAEIPDDRGEQEREYHRESRARPDVQDQFHRQQRQHTKRDASTRGQHANQIPAARPDHRDVRLQAVRIDDRRHGVGGVMKSVDKLEAQRQKQRKEQKHAGTGGNRLSKKLHVSPSSIGKSNSQGYGSAVTTL